MQPGANKSLLRETGDMCSHFIVLGYVILLYSQIFLYYLAALRINDQTFSLSLDCLSVSVKYTQYHSEVRWRGDLV